MNKDWIEGSFDTLAQLIGLLHLIEAAQNIEEFNRLKRKYNSIKLKL